jgi:hypothetical protein
MDSNIWNRSGHPADHMQQVSTAGFLLYYSSPIVRELNEHENTNFLRPCQRQKPVIKQVAHLGGLFWDYLKTILH